MTDYEKYWEGQTSPLHRRNDSDAYHLYGSELRLVLLHEGASIEGRVLEVGCGNGALFSGMAIDPERYVGVDVSDSMLSEFRITHPELELSVCNAANTLPDGPFDLIFGNAVHQHMSRQQLATHLALCRERLVPGGKVVLFNVPWRRLRGATITGELRHPLKLVSSIRRLARGLSYQIQTKILRKRDSVGFYYQPDEILKMTDFEAGTVYGSLFYPYRFTLALG